MGGASFETSACARSVGGDGERLGLDTADTLAIDDSESDVTLLTPGGVPGVLDLPVVEAGGLVVAPAGDEHGVVGSGTALGGVKDTTSVVLPGALVGLNGDREGLGCEGGLHLGDVIGGNEAVLGDLDGGGARLVVLASAGGSCLATLVGVDALELSLVGLPVLECLVLPSTVAAVVGGGAVNELLLGEGEELAGVDLVDTLEGTGGRERPAGTALALVLDGGDGTLGLPVNVARVLVLGVLNVVSGGVHLGSVTEHLVVLDGGEVREEVVTKLEVGVGLVALVDEALGIGEELKTGHELLNGLVLLAPLSEVVHELELEVGKLGGGDGGEGGGDEGLHVS